MSMMSFTGSPRHLHPLALSILSLAVFAPALRAQVQDPSSTESVVTVLATDAQASEIGPDQGVFTVHRSGSTNDPLRVFFLMAGTATEGVDYESFDLSVLIPAGSRSTSITVVPVDDLEVEETESVILRLIPPAAGSLPLYAVGLPDRAQISITDNDGPPPTNQPPIVQILAPLSGTEFPAGADIPIAARAGDGDGYVATVEFFAGTNSLGVTTNNPLSTSPVNPFQLIWSNVPPGSYVLTALATDDDGAEAWSLPVKILVGERPLITVVNIEATDAEATEIPEVPLGQERPQLVDPAVFTVTRNGNTNIDLLVTYRIGGTASNGVDYTKLSGEITIPAGSLSATIEVAPIDDAIVEGPETIILALETPVCVAIFPPPPDCYQVGPSARAAAIIQDDDTKGSNLPPLVKITAPFSGSTFAAPADITLRAVTVDPDGYANVVTFYEGTNKIGEAAVYFIQAPPDGQPIEFEFHWPNVPPGRYVLSARTVDQQGAEGVSEPVRIAVVETNRPPETNVPPIVSILARDPYAVEGTSAWGRNTATFIVSRHGATNSDLKVMYSVSGTASNGVDYDRLPGSVTIRAGRRSAEIVVNPIEDLIEEKAESVILRLHLPETMAGDTNPPPYRIGFPARGAALIVDNDGPRPPALCLSDRLFHLCLPATNGFGFRVEASPDLAHWESICTNRVTDSALHFVDPDAPDFPTRFYRVWPQDAVPLDE